MNACVATIKHMQWASCNQQRLELDGMSFFPTLNDICEGRRDAPPHFEYSRLSTVFTILQVTHLYLYPR